jgi:hypothetical protein
MDYSGAFLACSSRAGTEEYYRRNQITEEETMKKMLLTIALAVVASFAWGQTLRQPLMKTQDVPKQPQQTTSTTTTTGTEETGTITEYTPGSAIVLKETKGPVRYRFGKTVTYVTRSGKVLDEKSVRTRIKVGVPVRVHYMGTGENRVVDRIILEQG